MRALADSIEAADGAPPLSDQALSQFGSTRVRHLLATWGDEIAGYAQVDGDAAEVIGDAGAIEAVLDALAAAVPDVVLWAHGTGSRLAPILDGRGFRHERVLWQLRWPVTALPPVQLPDGVTVRAFVPGADEDAWLAVNAAAFAHHPEQGGWTRADVEAREAEPWFDPNGFLLAERAGELLGFHWTKRHSATLGEVYVIGVSPAAQGLRLGTALLIAGLEHLRANGIDEVLLYVDESNAQAMALYEKYGFQRFDHDVQFRRAAAPSPAS